MQTFLPYPSYAKSAKCLDDKRLGKQRVEVLTLLGGKWQNHPCAKMWRGYEYQLCIYGLSVCQEWIERGYKDACYDKIERIFQHIVVIENATGEFPPFIGNVAFHLSHQSNLVRKYPEHYRKYFPNVPDNLPYVWGI